VVQKPDEGFIRKCKKHPLPCSYFTVCKEDVASLCVRTGYSMFDLPVGINNDKFYPVSSDIKRELKKKYGFDMEKPLVIHVGHCSVGRGLEDFQYIDSAKFQSMVVASGMFDNEDVKSTLLKSGVKIHTGYLEKINEIYQMADAYFFPTQNDEYVISIPLSVMEALSCGVPVLAYSSFGKLRNIKASSESIHLIDSKNEINDALAGIVTMKHDASFLHDPLSWEEVAGLVYKIVNKGNGSYA
jgi:glycosyltransferase involved in cell wall biosynthesis